MAINPASLPLTWDIALVQSADQSQRWILSAMQSNGPALVNLLWRILGNETDVCDAYQDVFVRLVHLSAEQKPKHVRSYLFRTAANIAVSMLRREKLHKEFIARLRRTTDPAVCPEAGGELDAQWMQQRLREAIAQLPDYLGDVVVLRDLGEMSYGDVARILGITAGAARVYRHKAIQLLAVWMEHGTHDNQPAKQRPNPTCDP